MNKKFLGTVSTPYGRHLVASPSTHVTPRKAIAAEKSRSVEHDLDLLAKALIIDSDEMRQVADKPAVFELGVIRGRLLYYAAEPTCELTARLEMSRHSVYILGSLGGHEAYELPRARGCFLRDLVEIGSTGAILNEVAYNRLLPPRTSRILNGRTSQPLAALRREAFKMMLADHYARMRNELADFSRPSWEWIRSWFRSPACPSRLRREHLSDRTLYRTLHELTTWNGIGIDLRDAETQLMWDKCEDAAFVLRQSLTPLADLTAKAFALAASHKAPPDIIQPLPGGKRIYSVAP